MSDRSESKIRDYILDRWVSWLLELTVLGVVAYFAIAETRKTSEQTRAMLAKYDAAISKFAAEKSEAVDEAIGSGFESAKEKAKSIKVEDIKGMINSFKKKENSEENSESN